MVGRRIGNKLTARAVEAATKPGRYEDGQGLTLLVRDSGAKVWMFRCSVRGQQRAVVLGEAAELKLADARIRAGEIRAAARAGLDALSPQRRSARAVTFRESFDTFFALKAPTLANPKHASQWPSTLRDYVFPVFGSTPVAEVSASDVIAALQPIWRTKPETARRVLQRVEAVIQSAILRGHRTAASPTVGVRQELGPQRTRKDGGTRHFEALPYSGVPDLVVQLRSRQGMPTSRLCLEWVILTACRSGEARLATWAEVDEAAAMWTVPGARMKAGRAHAIPLASRCLEILAELRQHYVPTGKPEGLIFHGAHGSHKCLSDMTLTKRLRDMGVAATVHGFRSSFRNWAAESGVADPVAEACLAHVVSDKVVAAYRRSTFDEQRRAVMENWSAHCCSATSK